MARQEATGASAFHWNRAGWFGGLLGATVWLMLLGGMIATEMRALGALVLGLGLLPNALGVVLWRRRHALPPYAAMQAALAACALCTLAAVGAIAAASLSPSAVGLPAWGPLLFLGLMLALHLWERSARRPTG